MLPVYQCAFCRHYAGVRVVATPMTRSRWTVVDTCAAFPDGIPEEILVGRFNHRAAHPGDNGIQFDPEDEEADHLHRLSIAENAPDVPLL
jgi:hypothetical protein